MNVQVTSPFGSAVRVREDFGSDGQRVIDIEVSRKLTSDEQNPGMRLAEFCARVGVSWEAFRGMRYKATMPWINPCRPRAEGRGQELFHDWQVDAMQLMLRLTKLGVSHHAAAMAVRKGKGEVLEAMLCSILEAGSPAKDKEDDDVQGE